MTNTYEIIQRHHLRYRSLVITTQPEIECVSVAVAKAHMRIDDAFTADDTAIAELIVNARYYVEASTSRSLINRQYRMRFDIFPAWDIELPRPPIVLNTVAVTYVPSDATLTPVAYTDFRTDADSIPAVIRPPWNGRWPSVRGAEGDVTITWTAGYGATAESVPSPARHAMLMLVAYWYANREAAAQGAIHPVPMAVDHMLGTINWGQYA